ncbi:hypothetical protein SDC9_210705 [bioreactor metagenome]|uniref:Uncharacterized protein n=1 Tax=bioreactor metagenome TaxID=1076179 RepID=A0A645JIA8_9ZZZZ
MITLRDIFGGDTHISSRIQLLGLDEGHTVGKSIIQGFVAQTQGFITGGGWQIVGHTRHGFHAAGDNDICLKGIDLKAGALNGL